MFKKKKTITLEETAKYLIVGKFYSSFANQIKRTIDNSIAKNSLS